VFVNTARSWVVDQEALAAELTKGRFWAALDVYDTEPLPENSPLRQLDNVVLPPHIAGLTRASYHGLTETMLDEIERFSRGQPLKFQVTAEMLARMA